ncbi:MAG TPA: hypothetical protein VFB67_08090 [Candidatus Polarisedimenticolaceae bacterium]|nr:hypothetical protein [Candidatus Polarisedimenticolaceae bacterium]
MHRDQALELLLSERGSAILAITDGDESMAPHLRGGDAVRAVPVREPRPGDLLLYRQQDYWVVHRCLGPIPGGWRTRGDGRNVLDPPLAPENVRGRVDAVRRGGAWRSLEGGPARAYARLVGWHDLFWAGCGVIARKVGLARAVAALDAALLRVAAALLFPAVHRRIDGLIE